MNFKDLFRKNKEKIGNNINEIEILSKLWDKYAEVYEKSFGKISVFQGFAKELEEYLLPTSGGVVLDGGCGTGLHFERIIHFLNPSRLIGLDLSPKMLEGADKIKERLNQKYKCQIELKEADLSKGIPYSDNTFDAQIYHLVFYYLPSGKWKNALQEAFRVAKPGGYIITTNVLKRFDFKKEIGILLLLKEMILQPKAVFLIITKVKPILLKIQKLEEKGLLSYPSEEELINFHYYLGFEKVVCKKIWKDNTIMIRAHKPK